MEHHCDPLEPGRELREQLKPLAPQRGFVHGEAGDVPARLVNLTESYFVNQLLLRIKDLPRLTSAED